MIADVLSYALHYVILRTIYDGARAAGVPAAGLVGGAVAILLFLYLVRSRRRRGGSL